MCSGYGRDTAICTLNLKTECRAAVSAYLSLCSRHLSSRIVRKSLQNGLRSVPGAVLLVKAKQITQVFTRQEASLWRPYSIRFHDAENFGAVFVDSVSC